MHITRRTMLGVVGAAMPAPGLLTRPRAQAAVTLRLHHFLPPMSNAHAKLLVPWAERIATESQGRLRIEIFPAMQLGGRPPQLFDQARDGVVDIVWTLPGYTPGRFPVTEVFELPFICAGRSIVNARAAQNLAARQALAQETRDVTLLGFWAHDGGHIHANRLVRTRADLRGLRLRNPTRLAGEALRALGAVPVGMPVPQVPESLAQRVIDGAVVPWEVVPAVRLQELVRFHTEVTGSPAFYSATFFIVMNTPRYERLPDDLRAVLDRFSGRALADMAGAVWDTEAANVRAAVAARGNTITVLTDEERAQWVEATEPVHTDWIRQMQERNIDGARLVADVRALIAQHERTAT